MANSADNHNVIGGGSQPKPTIFANAPNHPCVSAKILDKSGKPKIASQDVIAKEIESKVRVVRLATDARVL